MVEGSNVTYRATYLIDEKLFHESVNDMPLGRNVNEYLWLMLTHKEKRRSLSSKLGARKEAMSADRKKPLNI
jgi:peroxiredoxin (alkyl hydroperoxide reductase subunit C)